MNADTNSIIRAYLVTQATLTGLIGGATPRIYCPRLPEGHTLPAVSYFTRGGIPEKYVKELVNPSVQFDCWATSPLSARTIYRALYDVLHGIENQAVVIGADTFYIKSALEEVVGQDLQDADVPTYFRVISFYALRIRAA